VEIVLLTVLAIRLSMRVVREKIGNKNLKTTGIRNGIRKKTDKAHVLDLLIVKAHVSPIHVLRRLMQTQFLVLLLPMPTIHRSLATKPGLVRRHAINDLYGVI
jgi:hypothetical protein